MGKLGEEITLEAMVTYGEEIVTDADEVTFEYWLADNRQNSILLDAHNHGDGTYSAKWSLKRMAFMKCMHTLQLRICIPCQENNYNTIKRARHPPFGWCLALKLLFFDKALFSTVAVIF